MDAYDYHNALEAHIKGGTIVIAFGRANEIWRLKANSFTSVSLDPNVLSFCLAKLGRVFSKLSKLVYFPKPPLMFNRGGFFSAPQTEAMA